MGPPAGASAGFVTCNHAAPGAALQLLLDREGLRLDAVEIVDVALLMTTAPDVGSTNKYSVAMAVGHAVPRDALVATSKALAPGARIYVVDHGVGAASAARMEQLQKDLLFSGFSNGQVLPELNLGDGMPALIVTATRPAGWDLGAKASLSLKKQKAAAPPAPKAAAAWVLSGADDNDELMDDNDLLTEEDLRQPAAKAADPSDCEVGAGRKACKNCSCGRAEAEAAGEAAPPVKLTQEMLDNPVSSCGNCSLGDAFRCSGCPYRGLPAFEEGKKITLPTNFLTADL